MSEEPDHRDAEEVGQLADSAVEQLRGGVARADVEAWLIEKGLSANYARDVMVYVEGQLSEERREELKGAGDSQMTIGGLVVFAAIAIALVTRLLAPSGGYYIIPIGLFWVGVAYLIAGARTARR